jgi:hypothetical protein
MKRFVAVALGVAVLAGCRAEEKTIDTAAHSAEVQQWQKRRDERLRAEDGWLTLIGLHWLNEGRNVVVIAKPGAPQLEIERAGDKATLHPAPGLTIDGKPVDAPVELRNDTYEEGPTFVQVGSVRFNAIKRGDRLALRVKDAEAATRTQFAGLEYYPIDPRWRVEAKLEMAHPPKKVPITDITGMTSESISPGSLAFEIDGKEYKLDPILEEGSDELFIIFRDGTSRDTTYPAGRYLYAKKPGADGKVIVDFNKAYSPPCIFTPYATCPLPPPQNRLPIRIEAGEKKYAGGHV